MPGATCWARRCWAAVTAPEPASSGAMRPGLSETWSAQFLIVGYAVKDDARLPSTCWRAQSAGVLENGAGGQSRFFSASSSSVASTYPTRAAP